MTNPKITLIVTGHEPLLTYMREAGLVSDDVRVVRHASVADVAGEHVFGTLPAHLMAKCASFTEIHFAFTPEDREAMRRGDIPVERLREVAAAPVCYYPPRPWAERPWAVARCFQAAAHHCAAAVQGTYHVCAYAQGTIALVSEGGGFAYAQVDLYRDRYRTMGMADRWSPWLDADGLLHRDQSDPTALGRAAWLDSTGGKVLGDVPEGAVVEIWPTGERLSESPERVVVIGLEPVPLRFAQTDWVRVRPEVLGGRKNERLLPQTTPCREVS